MTPHPQGTSTRRQFLGASSATAAGGLLLLSSRVLGRAGQTPPSDKLNIAVIGAGGRGAEDIKGVESQNIVALCDVDDVSAADSFKRFPRAARYRDFRVMLEKEKGIDAVVVATPDHTHAVASMAALKAGKHVYCEKPLTRTVHEARALARAAREAKVATQMGNQGMAFEGNRQIKEWLAADVIGAVREVHVWSDRPTHRGRMPLWWPQGIERPTDTPAVPSTLDWDLWLGPAPHRPYHPAYVPFRWRGWWDFGSGGLGDMGIHNLAPVFDALKLGPPSRVHASSTPVFPETVPVAAMVHYEFPARGTLPAVKVHWYDGGLLPARPDELEGGRPLDAEDGILFVGDKGKMLVGGWGGESPRLIPEALHREFQPPPKTLPRSVGHHAEWIEACKKGTPTASDFAFAGPLTEAVLLGSIAIRMPGEELRWDSAAMKIPNLPDAEALLHYAYRPGWSL
ncbi:MAG: Gfo/Idh/MocA family protein [Limisphaerales bacterium]